MGGGGTYPVATDGNGPHKVSTLTGVEANVYKSVAITIINTSNSGLAGVVSGTILCGRGRAVIPLLAGDSQTFPWDRQDNIWVDDQKVSGISVCIDDSGWLEPGDISGNHGPVSAPTPVNTDG